MAAQEIIPGMEAIAKKEPQALSGPNPMALLQMALSQNLDTERLSKFMDLADRWERNEARKAFTEAMTAFKGEAIRVTKDRENKQYASKYTSLGNMVNTVIPYLSKHGLSHRWEIDQTQGIKVTCIITHIMGHSESVPMIVPPDTSGAKNPIQQVKSAITYAKACTFESICGLASTDANVDDDGNGTGDGELSERLEWIANCKDVPELERIFKDAYKKYEKNDNAKKSLIAAKDRRKADLQ